MIDGFPFSNVTELFSRQLFDFRGIMLETIDVLPKCAGRPLQFLEIHVQLLGMLAHGEVAG